MSARHAIAPDPAALAALVSLARNRLKDQAGLVVLGVSGAQGSGKSTLAAALHQEMTAAGVPTVTLSLDDIYRTRAEREQLAATIHPLLITRGVPGTHDVALGLRTIDALARGEPVRLPRFDKARDDRRPADQCDMAPAGTRLLVFEGWCVGARAQDPAQLAQPINALEAGEDHDGRWRHHVNAALAGDYPALWSRLHALAMLRAPGFASVLHWRQQQEAALRATAGQAPGVMSDAEVARFVAHYERLTRHLLIDLPTIADLILDLDNDRHMTGITYCTGSTPSV